MGIPVFAKFDHGKNAQDVEVAGKDCYSIGQRLLTRNIKQDTLYFKSYRECPLFRKKKFELRKKIAHHCIYLCRRNKKTGQVRVTSTHFFR